MDRNNFPPVRKVEPGESGWEKLSGRRKWGLFGLSRISDPLQEKDGVGAIYRWEGENRRAEIIRPVRRKGDSRS